MELDYSRTVVVLVIVGILCYGLWEYRMSHKPYTFDTLLDILEEASPKEVALLRTTYRVVEHGLLSVGLKLHILEDMPGIERLIQELGGEHFGGVVRPYRRVDSSYCIVLPPVGSATAAISLVECLERWTHEPIFFNPLVQIQVCSPGRLEVWDASVQSMSFYLGSDVLRPYEPDDFETTFSNNPNYQEMVRGKRITIYDGNGRLDKDFDYWDIPSHPSMVGPNIIKLPFSHERTDVLTCTSPTDIRNVNLVTTLLCHAENQAWWEHLGRKFRQEFERLLEEHLLGHLLHADWVVHDEASRNDSTYMLALTELMSYALDEAERTIRGLVDREELPPNGILAATYVLLEKYRQLLIDESATLRQKE